jgi:acetylornithine/N-succinyldiaminopimelate aminotransferase
MAAAGTVIDVVAEPEFLEAVRAKGLRLKQKLAGLVDTHPEVFETVRGEGLMIGLKCRKPAAEVVAAMRARKLLCVGAGDNVIRFLPPLTISEADIDEAVHRADAAATDIEAASRKGAAA